MTPEEELNEINEKISELSRKIYLCSLNRNNMVDSLKYGLEYAQLSDAKKL